MAEKNLQVLVIDDSALYRKFVSSVLKEIPGVDVIGTASNGLIGLDKIRSMRPDLITLDLEMPEMDGLELLRNLSERDEQISTIVISSLNSDGAKSTNMALQLGAFDFVLKPVGKGPDESRQQLRADLAPKIEACLPRVPRRAGLTSRPVTPSSRAARPVQNDSPAARYPRSICRKPEVVVIGISTGGPAALTQVLPRLPADFPCPVLVVQHMPPIFTKSLAEDLNRTCPLEVKEASSGDLVERGKVLIAPGGHQMKIGRELDGIKVVITDDPPERNCRPAVDYLFRSVADVYRDRAVAAIMTGMGDDGTIGCQLMKQHGAMVLSQDEATCVVYGMPRSVFEAGLTDHVIPLHAIADSLISAVDGGLHHADTHA